MKVPNISLFKNQNLIQKNQIKNKNHSFQHKDYCDTITLSFRAKEQISMNNSEQNEKSISNGVKKQLSSLDTERKIDYISGLNKMSALAFAFYSNDDIKNLLNVLIEEIEKENNETLKKEYLYLAGRVVELIETDSLDILQEKKNSQSVEVKDFVARAFKYLKI